MINRLIRIVKNNWAILLGKQDSFYSDRVPEGFLPSEWISVKALDRDLIIFNAGFSKKHKGNLVLVIPMKVNGK